MPGSGDKDKNAYKADRSDDEEVIIDTLRRQHRDEVAMLQEEIDKWRSDYGSIKNRLHESEAVQHDSRIRIERLQAELREITVTPHTQQPFRSKMGPDEEKAYTSSEAYQEQQRKLLEEEQKERIKKDDPPPKWNGPKPEPARVRRIVRTPAFTGTRNHDSDSDNDTPRTVPFVKWTLNFDRNKTTLSNYLSYFSTHADLNQYTDNQKCQQLLRSFGLDAIRITQRLGDAYTYDSLIASKPKLLSNC